MSLQRNGKQVEASSSPRSILLSNINTFHRNGKQVEASSSEGIKCHKDSMKKELYVESGIDI